MLYWLFEILYKNNDYDRTMTKTRHYSSDVYSKNKKEKKKTQIPHTIC